MKEGWKQRENQNANYGIIGKNGGILDIHEMFNLSLCFLGKNESSARFELFSVRSSTTAGDTIPTTRASRNC